MERRWILGGLLVAGGVGLAAVAGARRRLVGPDTRLLLIGDSLAVGLDPHIEAMAREEGVEDYLGRGLVGSRIDQWAHDPWLDNTLGSFVPTLVLVSLGTNDEALGAGAAERQEHAFAVLLAKLEGIGADVVWIGPPELPFASHGVADMIRDEVRHYFPSEELEIPRSPDRLHPNVAGYAGWAGQIWRWIT